ncbi:manganese-dependent inorganic pyrophosphatase [Candidatus Nomurabacteria bacterium]|nr:manganese-dependent inorganic pyrophosphatase [Candidatus Nomurabacteria bacterium]
MNIIKVFGHQSPDTDATCSAIVWAWFLSTQRNTPATPYILGTPNTEAQFVLNHWGAEQPELLTSVNSSDTVSIVDTNNADELFENINECNIVSIIDHHKLTGGLKTSIPLEVVIQPYASTMTVMYNVMNVQPEDFPREIAGLMLSGVLSDTLEFRSPTTTDTDRELATRLAQALGVDMTDYANTMFAAKSDISHFSDVELLRLDSKIYELQGKQVRVSVLETTNPSIALDRKEKLVAAMDTVCAEDSVEQVMLFVINILTQEATVLLQNDTIRAMIEKGFDVATEGDTHMLPGVVSRKKQIIPALS